MSEFFTPPACERLRAMRFFHSYQQLKPIWNRWHSLCFLNTVRNKKRVAVSYQ
jgi:hypothetical protein